MCVAIGEAGLDEALSGGSWTVFAPIDSAFFAIDEQVLSDLLNDKEALTELLLFHAVDQPLLLEDTGCTERITMANGRDSRRVCKTNGIFQKGGENSRDLMPRILESVDGATNIQACNGIVHLIDKVMIDKALPTAAPSTEPPTMAPVVQVTPAPTMAPVVPVTPAPTVAPVVLVTPSPSMPPVVVNMTPPPTAAETSVPDAGCNGTIAELACGLDDFSILCSALETAGLDEVLSGNETVFTVFAPTNQAFEMLDADLLAGVLADLEALTDILLYHVVAEVEVLSTDLVCSELVEMANGANTRTVCSDGSFFQKGGGNPDDSMPEIISADIPACNGVVHVVDKVILP